MTTLDDLHRSLAAIRTDLTTIARDLRWAHNDGHWPKGANPDRVAGIHTQDVIGRDRDHDHDHDQAPPGERRIDRDDLGIGERTSRTAYRRAAHLVWLADLQLLAALTATRCHVQPGIVPRGRLAHLETALAVVATAQWRATHLDQAAAELGRQTRRQVALHVHGNPAARSATMPARMCVDHAHRVLTRALGKGDPAGTGKTIALCRICGIRDSDPKSGGRCKTCVTWKVRHGGAERPVGLDNDQHGLTPVEHARQAQERAEARGEGWGAA